MIKLNYKSESWKLPPVAKQNWFNISYFKCSIKQIVNWIRSLLQPHRLMTLFGQWVARGSMRGFIKS